jgi:DNA invertase Pin-like site-specific DNA recombinase
MPDPVLLGYVRELVCGPSIESQIALLASAGVTADKQIYRDELPTKRQTGRRMFGEITRALRTGDAIVVPSLAVFARTRPELSAGLAGLRVRAVNLLAVADEIDTRVADADLLFKFGDAERRAIAIWRREQTVNGTRAAKLSGRSGRRPRLAGKREDAARTLWLDPTSDKTNAEIAAGFGLSASRFYGLFGRRPLKE